MGERPEALAPGTRLGLYEIGGLNWRSQQAAIPPIHCLTLPGSPRRAQMQDRFARVGLTCAFASMPTTATDVRAMLEARRAPVSADFEYRTAAVMLGHLQLMQRFVEETSAPYGIFCEDDIYLRRTIRQDLPAIVSRFESLDLDVLLLGYLWPWKEAGPAGTATAYELHAYGADLWGTQMYLLSRGQAMHLLRTYTLDWAVAHSPAQPFAADWIITKVGKRARISPMLAVEEGDVSTTHVGQIEFHRRCAEAQYDPTLYI